MSEGLSLQNDLMDPVCKAELQEEIMVVERIRIATTINSKASNFIKLIPVFLLIKQLALNLKSRSQSSYENFLI